MATLAQLSVNSSSVGGFLSAISLINSPVEEPGTTITPVYTGGPTLVVDIPPSLEGDTIDNVSGVSIGGTIYQPFIPTPGIPSPPPYTYIYNPQTQQITLYVDESAPPTTETPITYIATKSVGSSEPDDYRGTLPPILEKWNITALTLNRSFESSPSGSFQFTAKESDRTQINSDFATGTKIVINEHGYAVGNVEITGEMSTLETVDRIEVSVSLVGPHDERLDNVVRLRPYNVLSGPGEAKSDTNIGLSSLCIRAGLEYDGPGVTIRVPAETPLRSGTTVGSEMSRSRVAGGFAFYSHPSKVQIREWGKTPIHTLGKRDILNNAANPITVSYGGGTTTVDGVGLPEPYENTELQIEATNTEGEAGRTNVYLVVRGGNLAGEALIIDGNLKYVDMATSSHCFDSGGITNDLSRTYYQNGVAVREERTVWGFEYSTADSCFVNERIEVEYKTDGKGNVLDWESTKYYEIGKKQSYDPVGGDWRRHGTIVREELTEHIFDGDGYLVRTETTIKERVRYRQESGQEAIEMKMNSLYYRQNDRDDFVDQLAEEQKKDEPNQDRIDELTNAIADIDKVREYYKRLLNLYTVFFWSTSKEITTYSLDRLKDYYPDIPAPSEGDPDPKFVVRSERNHSTRYESEDVIKYIQRYEKRVAGIIPLEQLPTTFTGQFLREFQYTTILYPSIGTSADSYQSGRDTYLVKRTIETAQGERLINAAKEDSSEQFTDRPSPAQRLETFVDRTLTPNTEEPETAVWLLRTPNTGLTDNDPSNGSISFPGGDTKDKAFAAAKLDIAIRNSLSAEVWQVRVLGDRIYSEGDRVSLAGKVFVIQSVSESFQIQGKGIVKLPFIDIGLGRIIAPDVSLSKANEG